jgi:general secretion pathway protein G
MSRRLRAGFTLLEMTLVLVLIGLLATLVVPRVLGRTAEARRVRAAADLQILAQALEGYRLDAGVYPTTSQGLDALVRAPTLPPAPARWRPDGYLPSVPRDPWNHAYQYACVDGRHFTLRSLGADGEPGGDGEAADVDVDAP